MLCTGSTPWASLNIDRGNTRCKGATWHGAQSSSRQSLSHDLPPRLHSDFMCLPRQRSVQVKVWKLGSRETASVIGLTLPYHLLSGKQPGYVRHLNSNCQEQRWFDCRCTGAEEASSRSAAADNHRQRLIGASLIKPTVARSTVIVSVYLCTLIVCLAVTFYEFVLTKMATIN